MKRRRDRIGDSNCEDLVGVLLLTKLEKYIATATTSAAILVRSGERSNRRDPYDYCFQHSFRAAVFFTRSLLLSLSFARSLGRDTIGGTHGSFTCVRQLPATGRWCAAPLVAKMIMK